MWRFLISFSSLRYHPISCLYLVFPLLCPVCAFSGLEAGRIRRLRVELPIPAFKGITTLHATQGNRISLLACIIFELWICFALLYFQRHCDATRYQIHLTLTSNYYYNAIHSILPYKKLTIVQSLQNLFFKSRNVCNTSKWEEVDESPVFFLAALS